MISQATTVHHVLVLYEQLQRASYFVRFIRKSCKLIVYHVLLHMIFQLYFGGSVSVIQPSPFFLQCVSEQKPPKKPHGRKRGTVVKYSSGKVCNAYIKLPPSFLLSFLYIISHLTFFNYRSINQSFFPFIQLE